MRAEKQLLTKEYAARLNASPFFIVVGYQGLEGLAHDRTAQAPDAGWRGSACGEKFHFRIAAKEAGVGDLNGALTGQLAVVTGKKDISAAAKALKNFAAEFEKLKLKFGYLEQSAPRRGGDQRAGGLAKPGCFARQ